MTLRNLKMAWADSDLVARQRRCKKCAKCSPSLIHDESKPIFGRFNIWPRGVLFVLEAPNWDDTVNTKKGYLTYDPETDPSGSFAHELIVKELQLDPRFFQVTNSVLCLPAKKEKKFPVSGAQMTLCSSLLKEQIRVLNPVVVASVGRVALEATRKIEDHGFTRMVDVVARRVPWFDRVLFPLFHTGRRARNGANGRNEEAQRRDWRKLRRLLLGMGVEIPRPES